MAEVFFLLVKPSSRGHDALREAAISGRCRGIVIVTIGVYVVSRRNAIALLPGVAASVLSVAVMMMTVISPSLLYTSNLIISNPKPKI